MGRRRRTRRVKLIRALRGSIDRRLFLQFCGSAITSDAELLPYRELDDAVGPADTGAGTLAALTGKNGRHLLRGMVTRALVQVSQMILLIENYQKYSLWNTPVVN
jgi:hypothetical protein